MYTWVFKWSLSFIFFHQSLYAFLCPIRATCFMHQIPDLIVLIKFGEEFLNTFSLCWFHNVKDKVICILYILISDWCKNQYTYICLGCLLMSLSKLCKPEVSNNCMLHGLCVAVTVILFGFSPLSGSSFSFLYFQSPVWTQSNFASVKSLPTLLSMGNHAVHHVRKQARWIKIRWFRNEQLTV